MLAAKFSIPFAVATSILHGSTGIESFRPEAVHQRAVKELAGRVFVNEDPDKVESLAQFCGLDLLQLHGDESATYCSRFNRPVIRALRLRSQDELQWLAEFSGVVDALLLDTYVPEQYGGTGLPFDWNLAAQAREFGRVILAGGLNPGQPGLKDHQKMARFIERVHQAAR